MSEGPVAASIRARLTQAFAPVELEILDESGRHAGHQLHGGVDGREGGESHFHVRIVSRAFEGLSRLARQRAVNACLAEELAGPVHALSITARAPGE